MLLFSWWCSDLWLVTLTHCQTGAHIELAELISFLPPKRQMFRWILLNVLWQNLKRTTATTTLSPCSFFLCFAAFLRWPDGRLQQRIVQQFLRRPSIRAAPTGRQSFTLTHGHREQPRSAPLRFFLVHLAGQHPHFLVAEMAPLLCWWRAFIFELNNNSFLSVQLVMFY